jgi:hypothetical protein
MKTAILQLESYDSFSSICDKFEWAHSARILIVWPKRNSPIQDSFELKQVLREAQERGTQVAIVCRDAWVKELAKEWGISVFSSVTLAERTPWAENQIRFTPRAPEIGLTLTQDKHGQPKKESKFLKTVSRAMGIVLATLAVLLLFGFFLPGAKVTLAPKIEERTIEIPVWASPLIQTVNINGNLPAQKETLELSGEKSGPSTGTTQVASTKATGSVILTNLSNQLVTLPKGTIIETAGEPVSKFLTDEEVSIPSGKSSEIEVTVTAEMPGTQGNVAAGSLSVLEGTQGAVLTVTNLEPFTGGGENESPTPTQSDLDAVKKELLAELKEQAVSELTGGDQLMLSSSEITTTVLSESSSVEPGQPGDSFTLSLEVRFATIAVSQQDLQSLAEQTFTASLANVEALYSLPGQFQLEEVGSQQAQEEGTSWNQKMTAQIGPRIDTEQLAAQLAGMSAQEAINYLGTHYALTKAPVIQIFPAFWQRLPEASFRITFQVEAEQ